MTCYFCSQNAKEINYRDVDILKKFLSAGMKIKPRKKTGVCSKHQRKLAKAIKRARQMALLPYLP
ncbi:MAG: 30S ribosomal protein S18 [Candidatus Parcubacteria bacterium]|nr:MAG: 30S ribosomal protein S18 [Candidatus Parcubacteria bacterium]